MWYVVPYVHEIGHATVCELSGHHSEVHIIFTGEARTTFCSDRPLSVPLYHAAGGLAGAGIAAILTFAPRNKTMFVAAFPFIIPNILQAIMETYAHRWYVNPDNPVPSMVSSGLVIGVFLALAWKKGILKAHKEERAAYSASKD